MIKRKVMKKSFLAVVLLLCQGLLSWGQGMMNLEDCRRLAMENNKALKMADMQLKTAQEKKKEAFTKYLPSIDAMGMYFRNQKEINLLAEDARLPIFTFDGTTYQPNVVVGADGVPVVGADGSPVFSEFALLPKEAMSVDMRNVGVLQVGLVQPVYMGGKIRAYNQLAGLSEQLAESGYALELEQVIEQTDEAYWQVVSLVNREKLAEKYVGTLENFNQNMTALYKEGMVTKADLLSVSVRLNQAEMALLRVKNGLGLARMALNRICGLPVDTVFVLQEEDLNQLALPEKMELEQVYSNRPEIHSLSLATDIYRRKERIARSEYLPSIALSANYLAMTPSFFDGISNKLNGMWSVGVGVRAPVFHWGASRKSVRSARAETELMNLKLEEAKEMIELQVNQAQFKVEEAMRKLEVAEANLSKADENLKYANLGFEEGTIPVLNVLEAQTAWLEAHTGQIDARIELKLCEVYLKKAYGVLSK